MNIFQDMPNKKLYDEGDIIAKEALLLINGLYHQYKGDMLHRLDKITNYLDESLFIAKPKIQNLFDNEPRENYTVLTYARYILIPKLYESAIATAKNESIEPDPLYNRNWN